MSKRLISPELKAELNSKRTMYALEKLAKKNVEIENIDDTKITLRFRGNKILLYPFTGWFTGKGIKDGRGIENLLKQI